MLNIFKYFFWTKKNFIKKEKIIIVEIGIKKTDDLQGKLKARVLLWIKNWVNEKIIDAKPKTKNGINITLPLLPRCKFFKDRSIFIFSL